MTLQISIPAKTVLAINSKTLDLDFPARCSRCDAPRAPFFETHPLHYRADLMPNRNVAHRYRINKTFKLRLPLCETCYRASFMEDPESCTDDATSLGKIARIRSMCIKIAATIALVGFVLLMGILPASQIPFLWLYVILVGVGLLGIVFGGTAFYGRQIRKNLPITNYVIRYPRAIVYEAIETEKPGPGKTAVFLRLKNEGWAQDCANQQHWNISSTDSPSEKESKNESNSDR